MKLVYVGIGLGKIVDVPFVWTIVGNCGTCKSLVAIGVRSGTSVRFGTGPTSEYLVVFGANPDGPMLLLFSLLSWLTGSVMKLLVVVKFSVGGISLLVWVLMDETGFGIVLV